MKIQTINRAAIWVAILVFIGLRVGAANRVVTTLADSGTGSFRQILAASSNGDSVTFATNGLLTLTSGELVVSNSVSISGPGVAQLRITSAGSAFTGRAMRVVSNATVYLSNLTLERSIEYSSQSFGLGGAALLNAGVLVISNCVVSSNIFRISSIKPAGAVCNLGVLTMIDCEVSLNIADASSFSSGKPLGGGIYNQGTLTLIRCNVSSNATVNPYTGFGGGGWPGGDGGGLFNTSGATAIIESSLFAGNRTAEGSHDSDIAHGGDGGAVYNAGTASIRASLFVGNSTGYGGIGESSGSFPNRGGNGGSGAGLFNVGNIRLTNCTFYGNMTGDGGKGGNGAFASGAQGGNGGSGGGLCNIGVGIAVNCTFTSNQVAASGMGGTGLGGQALAGTNGAGAGVAAVSPIQLLNCIVAGNTGVSPTDVSGAITSLGHNLFASLSGGATGTASDLLNIDALLAPLADNGGRTMTCSLLPGSPAHEAGDDGVLMSLATDQRGRPRRSGAHVDIGAFEFTLPTFAGLPKTANGTITFDIAADSPFSVVAATNVATPSNQWINLGPAALISSGRYEFNDTTATNNPHRFFRLRWP